MTQKVSARCRPCDVGVKGPETVPQRDLPMPRMGRYWKLGCPAWEEDTDCPRAREQLERVLRGVVTDDCRMLPSEEMAKAWHRALFDGLVPHPDYLGNFRNVEKTTWCLQGYDVRVGGIRGVSYQRVLEDLAAFFGEFRSRVVALDLRWQEGEDEVSIDDIDGVVELAAWAHGEWVRIHPFANGNGRTARLWANYAFRRYGLLPIVVVRPRPDEPYGIAARASMELGNHGPTKQLFWELLIRSYQEEEIID
jgi:fido (protein-threonine AMPylation protein)